MANDFYPEFKRAGRWQANKIPGRIVTAMTKVPFDCKPVNVSANGLAIQSEHSLLPHTEILLVTADMEVSLSLVWCTPPERADGVYQYGFRLKTSGLNLVEIFMAAGCINVRVLVVDDDAEITDLFASVLQDRGHQVTRASSGREAVLHVEQHPVDLIVSDAFMPDGNGLFLYQNTRSRQIPFVVVTGHGTDHRLNFPPEVPMIDKANIAFDLLPQVVAWICANDKRAQRPGG